MAIFDVRVTDTDARTHCHKAPSKLIDTQEREKKDKYLNRYHELREDFMPLVYSVDSMEGREEILVEKRMTALLAVKWQQPYH